MQKLTPEQAALVEENLSLAPFVLRKYYPALLKGKEAEDWIQTARIGLCQAASTFEPDKGFKFSTYAVKTMRLYIQHHIRRNLNPRRFSETPPLSLERSVFDDREVSLGDSLKDPTQNTEEAVWGRARLKKALELANGHPELLAAAAGFCTQREAGEVIGRSHTWVGWEIQRIRAKLEEDED